jgi:hypothetical protein
LRIISNASSVRSFSSRRARALILGFSMMGDALVTLVLRLRSGVTSLVVGGT